MKIQINKNQQAINFKKHVWTIIEIAKQKAEIGIGGFYYPKPINQSIDSYALIDAVEKTTEDSVFGGYRCIENAQIKFTIRN